MRAFVLLPLLLATAAAPAAAKPMAPPNYAALVAAPGRSADAVAMDANREPARVLDFMMLKPGMRSLDFLAGGGYYSEIMGRVVGPKGSVVAYIPAGPYGERSRPKLDAIVARQPNVKVSNSPAETFAPNSYDFAMIHLNYHDLYWESAQFGIPRTDPNTVLAALFRAMKPGGIVAIVDHVGPAGDTRAIVEKLHRIDPATTRADFARAGFVLDGESDMFRNAADDHTKVVFDPALRGHTDRMVLRFRKPK